MTAASGRAAASSVQFGRMERRGLLLGLSGAQLALLGAAAFVLLAAVRGAGATGLVVSAPAWGLLVAAGTVSVRGRSVPQWAPLLASWQSRHLARQHRASSIHESGAPLVLELPGLTGGLRLVDSPELGGVLVVDRRGGTLTAVARLRASGLLLDDEATGEHKAATWGRVLAGLCQQPSVVRVQVLTRIGPGGLTGARRWWREHCLTDQTGPAAALATLLDGTLSGTFRREHLLAVAIRTPRGRGDGHAGAVASFSAVAAALDGAGVGLDGWVDRTGLAGVLRRAYDPHAASAAEDLTPALRGPTGVIEDWARLRTDTAWHVTYWVAEWPRTPVDASFLQPLLVGAVGTRTLSLIAEPVPAGAALRQIRRARAEHRADATQRERIGQVEDRSVQAEVADLDRREAELVAGHGDLRFTGLLTVTAPDEVALDAACRTVEADAARAMCDLRRLVGQQGAAHLAATVPLARSVQ